MRVHGESGFILHSRHYSETSLLLEVFSRHHGRLGLIAKGARRPANRVRGRLNPFQPLLLGWSGRGELPVLTAAEPGDAGIELHGPALYCGFYLNELLLRLLHRHDPHEALYDGYRASIAALRSDRSNEAALRVFEKRLLAEVGYGLVLDRDIADNSPLAADAVYEYILERGPARIAEPELNRRPRGVRMRGTSLIALANDALADPAALREVKQLTRAALARHLGDKPLHSRKLFSSAVPAHRKNGVREANG